MAEQVIYLNGTLFRCWNTLGKQLKSILCLDDTINVKSLDVLNDVLYGGYGVLHYQESYTIKWQHFERCKRVIPDEILDGMVALFESHPNITMIYE